MRIDESASFDIRLASERNALARYHVDPFRPRDDSLTADQTESGLEALVAYLGSLEWMVWRWGGFKIPVGEKSFRSMDAGQAARLGLDLSVVSKCEGFDSFLVGFRNPRQFDDSIFEAKMARWCVDRAAVSRLRFGPKYVVLGHAKSPEFEVLTPLGWIVCECKRLHMAENEVTRRLTSITNAFDHALKQVDIGENARLEVECVGPVRGDLGVAARQTCLAAASSAFGELVRSGPFLVTRSVVGLPSVHQNEHHIQQGRVRVGNTPVGITKEFMYLVVSSPYLEKALVRAVGSIINRAHRQLPRHRLGIILVEAASKFGGHAAAVRLSDPVYAHCLAIGIVNEDVVFFSHRDSDARAVDWVLRDLTPTLRHRIREQVRNRLRFWRSTPVLKAVRNSRNDEQTAAKR